MIRRAWFASLLLPLLICSTLFQSSVRGFQIYQSAEHTPLHWAPGQVVNFSLAPGTPSIAHDSMLYATQAWTQASNGAIQFAEGPGGIIVTWDTTGAKVSDPLMLAFTALNTNAQNQITGATIVVNAYSYTWQRGGFTGVSSPDANGVRSADLDTVLLHETGHALGLDHADNNVSSVVGGYDPQDPPTMNSTILPTSIQLHADDVVGIQSLYPATKGGGASILSVTASQTSGRAPLKTNFSISSGDSSTIWSFGDGSTAIGAQPSHRYITAGTYIVKATSGSEEASVTIEVLGKRSRKPSSNHKR